MKQIQFLTCLFISVLCIQCAGGVQNTTTTDDTLLDLSNQFNLSQTLEAPTVDANKAELGRMLFYDPILSGEFNVACATCHHPAFAFSDALPLPIGVAGDDVLGPNRQTTDGHLVPRNSPTVFNIALHTQNIFWDGRIQIVDGVVQTPDGDLGFDDVVAAQAVFPITSVEEMRGSFLEGETNAVLREAILQRLRDNAEYVALFEAAFPDDSDPINVINFGDALAEYERQHTYINSPFDQYLSGNLDAMSERQKLGAVLFYGDAGCATCHTGPLQSDFDFHALAVPQFGPGKDAERDDKGRFLVTDDESDLYKFRTPTLRNIKHTGPYMHDGAYDTIEEAIRHHIQIVEVLESYDIEDQTSHSEFTFDIYFDNQDEALAVLSPDLIQMELTDEEMAQLVDFVENALTDENSLPENLLSEVPESVPSGLPVSGGVVE